MPFKRDGLPFRCVDWSKEKAKEREEKGKNAKDPYIVALSKGIPGATYVNEEDLDFKKKNPCVFRGLGKSPLIWDCINNNIDFMYVDTGYFGNLNTKIFHRVAYNNLQTLNHLSTDEIKQRFRDEFGTKWEKFYILKQPILEYKLDKREDHKKKPILIVPPSQKVFNHFGGSASMYTKKLINKINEISDRKVDVRKKLSRAERTNFSLQDQLRDGNYHCIVTFNSIASVEAIAIGVPAITLGPNAGGVLSETNLRNIDNPYFPTKEKIFEHFNYLKWCQFKADEMREDWCFRVIKCLQGDVEPTKFKIKGDFADV
tara:strand:- start:1393 stop:2337 length:945 start_codon:yes stop_codon:yes gene_type:complete